MFSGSWEGFPFLMWEQPDDKLLVIAHQAIFCPAFHSFLGLSSSGVCVGTLGDPVDLSPGSVDQGEAL